MIRDLLIEIWESIRRNKLRVALTGFAVSWGIFMLIVLLGAGNGLLNGLTSNRSGFVSNSMVLWGGVTSIPYDGLKEGRSIRLNTKDLNTTMSPTLSDVIDKVTPRVWLNGYRVSLGKEYFSSTLMGVYPSYVDIEKIDLLYGRFINPLDLKETRKVIVIDSIHALELLGGTGDITTVIGRDVKVGDMVFRVIGIYRGDEARGDTDAFVPFSTVKLLSSAGDRINNIIFTFKGLSTLEDNEAFESRYKAVINRNHSAAPNDPSSLWLWNRFTQSMQMNKAQGILQIALWILGIFTLLSGVVGVSNIMLITVKERTHEFGIRKAIGASPASIMRLIITESVAITAFFGYIGMVLGMAACEIMDKTLGQKTMDLGFAKVSMFIDPTVGLDVALEATLLLIIAGTLAGWWPARKASLVRPVEALSAE